MFRTTLISKRSLTICFRFNNPVTVLDCCGDDFVRKSYPQCGIIIEDPSDDPVYSKHNITCMGVTRSMTSRNYSCSSLKPMTFVSVIQLALNGIDVISHYSASRVKNYRWISTPISSTHPRYMDQTKLLHVALGLWQVEGSSFQLAPKARCFVPYKTYPATALSNSKISTSNMIQVNKTFKIMLKTFFILPLQIK